MTIATETTLRALRRAAAPALLAACLAAGPALAQTTVIQQEPSVERSETKIKEKNNGDVVVKQKDHEDGDTMKSKTIIKDGGDTSKTTTVVR